MEKHMIQLSLQLYNLTFNHLFDKNPSLESLLIHKRAVKISLPNFLILFCALRLRILAFDHNSLLLCRFFAAGICSCCNVVHRRETCVGEDSPRLLHSIQQWLIWDAAPYGCSDTALHGPKSPPTQQKIN